MQIQINTDDHIRGDEQLVAHIEGVVRDTLSRFVDHITRVEVHLSDQGGHRGKHQKRCMMEVRVEGRRPTTVTNDATSMNQAVDGAADKLTRLLETSMGRQHDHHPH